MRLFRYAASIGLAVGLCFILVACPPPETENDEVDEPEAGETADEEQELTSESPRFVRAKLSPVVLLVSAGMDTSMEASSAHEYSAEDDPQESESTASGAEQSRPDEDQPLARTTVASCELDVLPYITRIHCDAGDDPRRYDGVRWCVGGAGNAPDVAEVCVDAKPGEPQIFHQVPFCIDLNTNNCVKARPDCSVIDGTGAAWNYRVQAKDDRGENLCEVNPPQIYIEKGGG